MAIPGAVGPPKPLCRPSLNGLTCESSSPAPSDPSTTGTGRCSRRPWETREPNPRPIPPYEERKRSVAATLSELDRWGRDVEIRRIESEFGFADDDPDLDALVVSPETDETVAGINRRREERGMDPLEPVVVPYAYAEDGERISSTRIVAGEIDEHGNVLS